MKNYLLLLLLLVSSGNAIACNCVSMRPFQTLDDLKEYEFIVEYLEKVEKIMSGMGYDIKNIIEIQKLEQL